MTRSYAETLRVAGVVVCLLCGSSMATRALGQTASVAAASLRQKIGFYQWRGQAPRGEDLLTAARRRATATGAGTFRLYLGGRFDYVHPVLSPRRFEDDTLGGPVTLKSILSLPRYRAVLDDEDISTVVLTAYAVQDYGAGPDDLNLLRPWGAREETTERQQIAELCEWLYQEFGQQAKTVIISNHEADEKLLEAANYTGSPELAVETLRRWTRARFEAIEAARQKHGNARLRIWQAFEISLVNLRIERYQQGYRKAAPGNLEEPAWRALDDVVPDVRFDLISYSAYESSNSPYETQRIDHPPEEATARLRRDLDKIRVAASGSLSSAGRRQFGDRFVMIGELGFARERFEPLASGGLLPRLYYALRAASEWGCPYIVLWQVFDHPLDGGMAWGFGMHDRAGGTPALSAPSDGCNSVKECLQLLFDRGFGGWAEANGYAGP